MRLLDQYYALRVEILQYFGYGAAWAPYDFSDFREHFWYVNDTMDRIHHADTEESLRTQTGDRYYEDPIPRHDRECVLRAAEYTLIVVDTQTSDGLGFMIFTNANERPHLATLEIT